MSVYFQFYFNFADSLRSILNLLQSASKRIEVCFGGYLQEDCSACVHWKTSTSQFCFDPGNSPSVSRISEQADVRPGFYVRFTSHWFRPTVDHFWL